MPDVVGQLLAGGFSAFGRAALRCFWDVYLEDGVDGAELDVKGLWDHVKASTDRVFRSRYHRVANPAVNRILSIM